MIDEMLEGTDKFLVELILQTGNRISIFIDGDSGVTIEDCRILSHHLEERMNRDAEDFELTVSSAGIDRPLTMPRQYKKNIGRGVEIITKSGEKSAGTIISVNEEGIEITPSATGKKKKEIQINQSIPYQEIKKATIKIDFRK